MIHNPEWDDAKTLDDLLADLEDLRLRIAFQAELEEDLIRLEVEAQQLDSEVDELDERLRPHIYRLFAQKHRRAQLRYVMRNVVPKAAHAAAMLLLVFFIGLSTAVATVQPVRLGLIDFIMRIENEYTTLELKPTGTYVEVPEGWQGDYYMSYIPEGYALDYAEARLVSYSNADGKKLLFFERTYAVRMNMDSEDAVSKAVSIGDAEGRLYEKNGEITVVWNEQDRYFLLTMFEEESEVLRVARDVSVCRSE